MVVVAPQHAVHARVPGFVRRGCGNVAHARHVAVVAFRQVGAQQAQREGVAVPRRHHAVQVGVRGGNAAPAFNAYSTQQRAAVLGVQAGHVPLRRRGVGQQIEHRRAAGDQAERAVPRRGDEFQKAP